MCDSFSSSEEEELGVLEAKEGEEGCKGEGAEEADATALVDLGEGV